MHLLRATAALLLVLGCGGGGGKGAGAPALDIEAKDGGADVASPPADLGSPIDVPLAEDASVDDVTSTDAPEPIDTSEPTDIPELADLAAPDVSPADTAGPPPLFDMPAIVDAATAQCSFTDPHTAFKDGVLLDVWKLSYISWESIDGVLQPILIRGFAARPSTSVEPMPGVVQAHGLGGYAEESHATGTAALLGAFVIAYTGPGGGTEPDNTSEGLPAGASDGYRLFDTLKDPRGSWFWGHAVAGMRGITCLVTRPEVDASRLGMTGFSAGGVVTLMASGVDSRIAAAVPLSGTGAWGVATQSPAAWQHALLTKAGLSIASPEWTTLLSTIGADVLVAGASAKILMVNGSTDEFFPLTAHLATFIAIPGTDARTSIAANFDHGCYKLTGVESAADIEARAELHAKGGQRMWFGHWFGTDPDYAVLPATPVATVAPIGPGSFITAVVDTSPPKLEVEEVRVWWSGDDSFIYGSVTLDPAGGGVWSKLTGIPIAPNTITFVDVQYKTQALLFPERFTLSSLPAVPAGLVPHIRGIDSCL